MGCEIITVEWVSGSRNNMRHVEALFWMVAQTTSNLLIFMDNPAVHNWRHLM